MIGILATPSDADPNALDLITRAIICIGYVHVRAPLSSFIFELSRGDGAIVTFGAGNAASEERGIDNELAAATRMYVTGAAMYVNQKCLCRCPAGHRAGRPTSATYQITPSMCYENSSRGEQASARATSQNKYDTFAISRAGKAANKVAC